MSLLNEKRFLIIEDEEKNRDMLLRLMIDDYNIPESKIREAQNLLEAEEEIDNFEPHIVLLDLKIPVSEGMEPEMINAFKIIQKAEYYNFKQVNQNDKIKIIVISGSIQDRGVQKILSLNKEIIFDFFDKGAIASNYSGFKIKLGEKLERAAIYEGKKNSIEYSYFRDALLKEVSAINPNLWEKIDVQILQEFEKLNDTNVNESVVSKSIIGTCGEIVEDLIQLLNKSGNGLPTFYINNENSVLSKLTFLSGRRYNGWDNGIKENQYQYIGQSKIRRASQEYAVMLYRMRSQALHGKEGDGNNSKWYAKHNFSREDAVIAINLLVPLIRDYIECK